jgi:hypothetical protein
MLGEIDGLQVGAKQVEFFVGKREQDEIADCFACGVGAGAGAQGNRLARACRALNDDRSFHQDIRFHKTLDASNRLPSLPESCRLGQHFSGNVKE